MTGAQKVLGGGVLLGVCSVMVILGGITWSGIEITQSAQVINDSSEQPAPPSGLSDFELGQYYFNQDEDPDGAYDLDLARQHYIQSILDNGPDGNNLVWYQLGRIDFIEGKFNSALYKFDKQIEYFGDSYYKVYYMIGLTYGYKARRSDDPEDWEKGAEGFLNYIEYDAIAPWPRVDLAWIYFAQGKYEEMLAPLEEGLALSPDNAWLLNMYGLALMNTGQREAAKEQFLLAQAAAAELTVRDWGLNYPGNNPDEWPRGLTEFQAAIEKNLVLVSSQE